MLDLKSEVNLPESAGEPIKELYQDAGKPIAQSLGQVGKIVMDFAKTVLYPIERLNMSAKKSLAKCVIQAEAELADYKAELIGPPADYIAAPIIQGFTFSSDSDELQSMYVKLLSKAMYEPTKGLVHPAYAEFIKQMSPVDAVLFRTICNANRRPLISLLVVNENVDIRSPEYIIDCADDIMPWTIYSYQKQLRSLNNLERLSLLKGDAGQPYPDSYYDVIKTNVHYTNCLSDMQSEYPNYSIHEIKGRITIIPMGQSFFDACVAKISDLCE